MSKRWPAKKVIGLTGNIATGKSVVRRMLEHLGAFSIDADGLAHRAMSPGAPAYLPVVETFGKFLLDPNGHIDRKKLANVVFHDPEALDRLEKITHPIVIEVIGLLVKRAPQEVVVIEAIKLFESGLANECDSVWVVDAPEDVQIKRLTSSRGMSEPEARMRISAQPAQKEKLARAGVIINNADGYEKTFEQVQAHLDKLVGVKPEATPASAPAAPSPATPTAPAPTAGPIDAAAAISVTRSGPKEAQMIADFLNQHTGTTLSRTDVLQSFGDKAYLLAYSGPTLVAIAGWQVENLITRVTQLVLLSEAPVDPVIKALIKMIEESSSALQAEVALIFLSKDGSAEIEKTMLNVGYERQTTADFRIPDWREAAEESQPPNTNMLARRLRTDRILKPI